MVLCLWMMCNVNDMMLWLLRRLVHLSDIELLQAVGIWVDTNTLLCHLDWRDYVQLQFSMYEKLVWELFSSFTIDTEGEYYNGHCYIHFRMDDITYELNSARFSELLQLPSSSTANFVGRDYDWSEFWGKITCHGQPHISLSSKATSMCNPSLCTFSTSRRTLSFLDLIAKGCLRWVNYFSCRRLCIEFVPILPFTS